MTKLPLERAARALCKLDGHPEDATMDGKPLWQDYLPEARAVVAAILEPSERMYVAGESRPIGDVYPRSGDVRIMWQAMLSELLAERK